MSHRPVVLMILDGYGLNDNPEANAVAMANTPVMDKLMAECPFQKGPHCLSGTDKDYQRDSGRSVL